MKTVKGKSDFKVFDVNALKVKAEENGFFIDADTLKSVYDSLVTDMQNTGHDFAQSGRIYAFEGKKPVYIEFDAKIKIWFDTPSEDFFETLTELISLNISRLGDVEKA